MFKLNDIAKAWVKVIFKVITTTQPVSLIAACDESLLLAIIISLATASFDQEYNLGKPHSD